MSYLLEALKRIEERRQDRGDSDLLRSDERPSREAGKKAIWPYTLSAALLVNAVVAVWLLGPWRTASNAVPALSGRQGPTVTGPAPSATAPLQMPSSPAATESPNDAGRRVKPSEKGPANQVQSQRPQQPATAGFGPADRTAGHSGKGAVQAPDPGPSGNDVENASLSRIRQESAKPGEERVTAGPGLPSVARQGVSELRLSLHTYSPDPKSRLVRIDERTVREGDTLATGGVVEEITPDGVVINNRGTRVHLKVQN